MMWSKFFGITFFYFVFSLILNIFDTPRSTVPLRNSPTEIVNLLDVSGYPNKPGKVVNITCASKSKPGVVFNENWTTRSAQWCDSCINYHQYKALIYPKHTPDNHMDMVIFLPSRHGGTSFQRRQFLRKFPLNSTSFSIFFYFWHHQCLSVPLKSQEFN